MLRSRVKGSFLSPLYQTQLTKAIDLFNDKDKRLTASKELLGLASIVQNDAFKVKINHLGEVAKNLALTFKALNGVSNTFNPMFDSLKNLKNSHEAFSPNIN